MAKNVREPRSARTIPAEKPKVEAGIYRSPSDANWGGFVNVKLTAEQKADFHTWREENTERVWEFLDAMLGEEMKLGVSYDRENQCYIVTLTGAIPSTGDDTRYVLTSRAGNLSEALDLSVWKHVVLLEHDWGKWRPSTGYVNNWG